MSLQKPTRRELLEEMSAQGILDADDVRAALGEAEVDPFDRRPSWRQAHIDRALRRWRCRRSPS